MITWFYALSVEREGNPHRLTAVTGLKGVDDEARSSAN
ncbi:hypothetical protein HNR77_001528 [Paenibacillus sp. JGP012]|nr:hypothetical protein [Paenibacillus sp. JGP012]